MHSGKSIGKERGNIMGMKAKTKTEVKILMDRLKYIAGEIWITSKCVKDVDNEKIKEGLGYVKNDNGQWKRNHDGCPTLEDTYKINYIIASRKLDKFYKALHKLPNEKLKRISELRFIEGWAWKEIAKEIDESERMTLNYREVLAKHFNENDCGWVLKYDSLYG